MRIERRCCDAPPRLVTSVAALTTCRKDVVGLAAQGPDLYYEERMIGGPGAFIVVAEDYTSFASAILSKLLLEIAGEVPPPRALAAR